MKSPAGHDEKPGEALRTSEASLAFILLHIQRESSLAVWKKQLLGILHVLGQLCVIFRVWLEFSILRRRFIQLPVGQHY